MSIITLPGSIHELLRCGSPVFNARDRLCGTLVAKDMVAAVFCSSDGDIHRLDGAWALDLTDATGRAHAAWWLAQYAKHWPDEPVSTTAIWRRWRTDAIGIGPVHWWPWSHHTIADLDPNDPSLLPDGSRWVDAEALRRVVLHVAGVTP
jgi:hypothetical protein